MVTENQDASFSSNSKRRTRRTRRRCRLRRVRASTSSGQRTRRILYHPFVKKDTSTTKYDKHPHLTQRLLNHIFYKNKKTTTTQTTRVTDEPSHAKAQAEKKQLSHDASVSKNSASKKSGIHKKQIRITERRRQPKPSPKSRRIAILPNCGYKYLNKRIC